MEPNYPGNSHSKKTTRETKVTVTSSDDKAEPKKVDQVVTGEVTQRKKPLGKRFAETFIGGDAKTVAGYVIFDVLVPAAKDTIADAVSQGIEKMLFGEARSAGRRTGIRPTPGGVTNYTSYNRITPQPTTRSGLEEFSKKARATHDFDEIIIPTRAEAEMVIERLFDLVGQYDVATVSDLYQLVGISTSYTDAQWGWDDMRGSGVERTRNGYLLNLPKPKAVD